MYYTQTGQTAPLTTPAPRNTNLQAFIASRIVDLVYSGWSWQTIADALNMTPEQVIDVFNETVAAVLGAQK